MDVEAVARETGLGDRDLLPDFLVERVRVQSLADEFGRADDAALHPLHHRRGQAKLACGRSGNDSFSAADRDFHDRAEKASFARHHIRGGAPMTMKIEPAKTDASAWGRPFRRGSWETLATVVISVGVVTLRQPFWLVLYSYSFITILTGVVMFVVVTKFPD
jgi:hypothetical protein